MFEINTIYRALPDTPSIIDGVVRLVGISPNRKACLMRLDQHPFKVPFTIELDDLINAYEARKIDTLSSFDMGLPSSEDELPEKAAIKLANHIKLMTPLVYNEKLIFCESKRNKAFIARAKETEKEIFHASLSTIRKLFLKFLASGGSELAYAPRHDQRGGVGEQQKSNSNRRGPQAKHPKNRSCVKLIDVQDKLTEGLNLYYFSGQYILKDAYHLTLKRSFVDHAKLERFSDKEQTPKLKEILLPTSKLPTERQFRYRKDQMEQSGIATRKKRPRKSRQPEELIVLSGSARKGLRGPGDRFEIDASKYQTRIVSKYDRSRPLEPPTLYLIIDVWSGAIVGYAFSLESEGWSLTIKALLNCFEDKQKTFDRLGLPFKSKPDWCSCQLPSKLTADRASMVSDKAGPCIETTGHVEITEAWRGDRKGTIENAIKRLKFVHDYHLPGSYPKKPGRGESDGIATAALTFEELEKRIVETIVELNSMPVPEKNIPIDMELDGSVPLTYIGLYEWGLRNRPGHTRTIPPHEMFLHLMSADTASVTEDGLLYKTQLFNCAALDRHGYLAKAKRNGQYRIDVRFYEHLSDYIWYFDEVLGKWLPAENQDEDIRRLKISFFELENRHQQIERLRAVAHGEYVHRKDERRPKNEAMIDTAKSEAKKARAGKNKTTIKKGIKGNHQTEKLAEKLRDTHDQVSSYMSGIGHEQNKPAMEKQKKLNRPETVTTSSKPRAIDRWKERFQK
jgi:hypothetical protein